MISHLIQCLYVCHLLLQGSYHVVQGAIEALGQLPVLLREELFNFCWGIVDKPIAKEEVFELEEFWAQVNLLEMLHQRGLLLHLLQIVQEMFQVGHEAVDKLTDCMSALLDTFQLSFTVLLLILLFLW